MNATASRYLVINGQTVSTDMVVIPGLAVSVSVLVGADPAFPGYRQMVDFDPIGDWMCQGAELGDAVPVALVGHRDGHVTTIEIGGDGERILSSCDCHGRAWPADMLTFREGPDTFECALPRDDNPLPAAFQRQAMR